MESFLSAAAKCENEKSNAFCAATKFKKSKVASTNPAAF